jgi:hypothetical protein
MCNIIIMIKIICIICIIIYILFILYIYFNSIENYRNKNNISSDEDIPKIIWSYWDNNPPEFIQKCKQNWAKFAPNYKIIQLNKNNVEKYIKNMPYNWQNLKSYRQADILRLKLLEKYGGVWMDASIILLDNPDNFLGGDITLFTTPSTNTDNPIYENWFIASKKGNILITKWINEVEYALKNPPKYIASSSDYNKKLVESPNYLICHLALRNIYDKNKNLFKNGKYYNSTDTAFYEHDKYNWKNVIENVFKNFKIKPDKFIIKFTGKDRRTTDITKIIFPNVLIE